MKSQQNNGNLVKKSAISPNIAEYEAMLDTITSVPAGDIVSINVPPETLIDKAEKLSRQAQEDREALEKAGLSPEVIGLLEPVAGALRHSVADCKKLKSLRNQWKQESPEAYQLLKVLVRYFLFAYRHDPEILAAVRDATRGYSKVKFVQQLENLSVIGKAHKEKLEATGFDLSLLDKASVLSARMGDILGEMKSGTVNGKDVRRIRLQAYSLLKKLVSEVCRHGKFAFFNDEGRLSKYTLYFTRTKKRASNEEAVPEVAQQREAA